MITFDKFCTAIATAIGGSISRTSHGTPVIVRDGRQVVWMQGSDTPGTKLADISDLLVDGRSYSRCYLSDDNDGSFWVWDNLTSDYDEREGQVLLYHGKRLGTAIKKALSYNPFTDSKSLPLWD